MGTAFKLRRRKRKRRGGEEAVVVFNHSSMQELCIHLLLKPLFCSNSLLCHPRYRFSDTVHMSTG
jgi:hypothetical protein